ncbi:MAG: CBS domain containing-hemolysin-like protein [Verrucomicrobiales bacterium]
MLANAFFVAAEFSLVAVDRNRVDEEAEAGSKSAIRVKRLVENLSFHLSGAQMGIGTSSVVLGVITRPVLATQLERPLGEFLSAGAVTGLSIVLAVAFATGFQMVVGELVPKTIAIDRPFEIATRLSIWIGLWGTIAKPIIMAFDVGANAIVRRLGMEPVEELAHTRSLDEIERMIVTSGKEGELDEEDVELLTRSIRLSEKTAAEALIPRGEVLALDRDSTGDELVELSTWSGKSRFPVYGDDADDVIGVAHIKAIHGVPRDRRSSTLVIDLMTEPVFIPESVDLDVLLQAVRESRNHLVVVVDEHGGTAGIITLEDILEEIVGEIDDEYDIASPTLTRVEGHGSFLISGSLHHDEVLEACGFDMPEGEYETLAGFVLDVLGLVPSPGARFIHDGWQFEVVAMDRRRVASVRLVVPPSMVAKP